jgi:uncharacterized membrane protein (DUF2068 family)
MAAPRRDRAILLIALFKLAKATVLIALGAGALSLVHEDVAQHIQHVVSQVRIDPHNRHIHGLLESIGGFDDHKLKLVGVGTFVYAAIFLVEGVALLSRRTWAEWLTVGVTGSFIPLEVWETVRHFTPLRLGAIALNVAIVAYLAHHAFRKQRDEKEARGAPSKGGEPHATDLEGAARLYG